MKKITIQSKPAQGAKGSGVDAWVQDRQTTGEPTKRLTVDLPSSLHRRIKSQCALREENMADVIRELLERHFAGDSKEAREGDFPSA